MGEKTMGIAMFPWFAMGHLTPYLHLSNKLAKKGHKISFFVPGRTQSRLQHFNLYPDLITFIPVSIPHVDGLPPGAETTSDIPFPLLPHLMTAMDNTEKDIELFLRNIKPHFIFFDFAHWIPSLAHRLGIKAICYCVINPVVISYMLSPARQNSRCEWTESFVMQPPSGFPSSTIKLHNHEARGFAQLRNWRFGSDVLFYDRKFTSLNQSDVLAFRTSREIEGPFIDYLESQFAKPVLLTGPIIPETPTTKLDEKWAEWLARFNADSVIYCALGSECILKKDQFEELVLGLELSGRPFIGALKPPSGEESVEAALPEGFSKRVEGRGIVHGAWVQQQLILEHPSVGCFVTHCGSGSLLEALLNKCQLVLLPQVGDQILNARMMSNNLKVGVEVEKGEEDGLFSKESVCKAIRTVMEKDSEIGEEVRGNHGKLRELLLKKDLDSSYLHSFCERLQSMLD